AAALNHGSPRVQRAALVLLDQPPHEALKPDIVLARVFADDESLRRAARASLSRHPDWVEQALPVVERLVASASPDPGECESLRGFVIAFAQQPSVARLVTNAVTAETGVAESLRVTLLDAMAQTTRDKLPAGWREAFSQALRSHSAPVRAQALRAVN